MLFELKLPNPVGPSSYMQHRYVDALLLTTRPNGWQPRDYIWCETDGVLFVRRAQPTNDLDWRPYTPPNQDSTVTVQVTARCRINTDEQTTMFGYERRHHGARPSIIDSFDTLTWFERIGEMSGLRIEDTETETVQRAIDMPPTQRRRYSQSFVLTLTSFTAVATVIDSARFEQALALGIGDSKAFGCGYIHVWERGRHA